MQQEPEQRERAVVHRDQHALGSSVLSLSFLRVVPDRFPVPDSAKKVNYRKPGFLRKFAELQAVMWQTNAGLTDRHAYDSRPSSWPLLKRGINLCVAPFHEDFGS